MNYDLDLKTVVKEVVKLKAQDERSSSEHKSSGRRLKANRVLLQFPDGLKPYSSSVVDFVEAETGCSCFIWAGSCYGACDLPNVSDFDLVVQFGHNKFGFEDKL